MYGTPSGPKRKVRLKRLAMKLRLSLVILLLSISTAMEAQGKPRFGVVANVGYSRSESQSGLGVAGGGSFRWSRLLISALADFTIVPTPGDERYFLDTFSNGQQRCRDRTNGQFARTELCSGSVYAITAGMFDINIIGATQFPIFIGAGYRAGPAHGAYLNLGYAQPVSNNRSVWFIKSSVGRYILPLLSG